MPSFLIQTLGCKLNQLESEAIAEAFSQAGFAESGIRERGSESGKQEEQNADNYPTIIIINTCTVTSKADQKARRVIRKALRDYPESCVIVTGCYAQLNKEDMLGLETGGKESLFVIKKDDIINLPQYLNDELEMTSVKSGIRNDELLINNYIKTYLDLHSLNIPNSSFFTSRSFQFNPKRFSQHTRSFLKIQDGCDNHCTYCKIRLVRGPGISLEKEEVLSRLRILEENHAEAVLTGVNICQYRGSEIRLSGLLEYILKGTEKIAIRLSSLAPDSINESFAGVLSHPRIRPHFHLSVQSGSKKILDRMGRSYDGETVEKAVFLLRNAKDDPFIACDIIAGFPGETEDDFNQTVSLCEKLDFAFYHVFPYSKRNGTPAFAFSDTIAESEITRRVQLLTGMAKQGKEKYALRWIGREVDVLIENSKHQENGFPQNNAQFRKLGDILIWGTSENYLKTLVRCKGENTPLPGSLLRCKIYGCGNLDKFDVYAGFF